MATNTDSGIVARVLQLPGDANFVGATKSVHPPSFHDAPPSRPPHRSRSKKISMSSSVATTVATTAIVESTLEARITNQEVLPSGDGTFHAQQYPPPSHQHQHQHQNQYHRHSQQHQEQRRYPQHLHLDHTSRQGRDREREPFSSRPPITHRTPTASTTSTASPAPRLTQPAKQTIEPTAATATTATTAATAHLEAVIQPSAANVRIDAERNLVDDRDSAVGSTASSANSSRVFSPPTSSVGAGSTSSTATYYREHYLQQQQQHRNHLYRSPALSLLKSAARSILDDATPSPATPSSQAAFQTTDNQQGEGIFSNASNGDNGNNEETGSAATGDDNTVNSTARSSGFFTNSSFDSAAYLSTWRTKTVQHPISSSTHAHARNHSHNHLPRHQSQQREPHSSAPQAFALRDGTHTRSKQTISPIVDRTNDQWHDSADTKQSQQDHSPPVNQFQGPIFDSPYSLASSSYDEQDAAASSRIVSAHSPATRLTFSTPAQSAVSGTARQVQHSGSATQTTRNGDRPVTANVTSAANRSALSQLASLQVEKMPALPNEQDRKRFLGCLAAILASSYDYDVYEEPKAKTRDGTSEQNSFHEQQAYLDMVEQSTCSLDESEELSSRNMLAEKPSLQPATQSQSMQQQQQRGSLHQSASESFEYTDVDELHHDEVYGNGSSSNEFKQHRPSGVHDSTSISNTPSKRNSSSLMWTKSKSKEKIILAKRRHRRRRYHVMCKLLIQSSDLLLLEGTVGKAFIPMLADVLVPPKPKDKINAANKQNGQSRRGTHEETRTSASPALERSDSDGSQSDLGSSFESLSDLHDLPSEFGEDEVLRPFLESLTPGAGIRCLSLFLLQHLLSSEVGYDARIRHVVKKLGVLVLARDMQHDELESAMERSSDLTDTPSKQRARGKADYDTLLIRATRKFESLESSIAHRIILLSGSPSAKGAAGSNAGAASNATRTDGSSKPRKSGITREQIVRGVKIGSAGLIAGAVFALSSGTAAFAIAGAASSMLGATATAAALTTPISTIFGVGGGGLAAYKMQRRTQGLTEFDFCKEKNGRHSGGGSAGDGKGGASKPGLVKKGKHQNSDLENDKQDIEADLFSVICISGWLTDSYDYQRPWGVQPTRPRLTSRLELLERFYAVHSPEHVPKCAKILACWKGEEDRLWDVLRQKYGTDPDHLYPILNKPHEQWSLTLEQEEVVDGLFVELGYNSVAPKKEPDVEKEANPLERMRKGWKNRTKGRFRRRGAKNRAAGNDDEPGDDDDDDGGDDAAAGDGNGNRASTGSFSASGSMRSLRGAELSTMRGEDVSEFGRPAAASLRETTSNDSTGWEDVSSADLDDEHLAEHKKQQQKLPKHLPTVWDFKSKYGGELYTVRWESRLLKTIHDCVMDMAIDMMSSATKHLLKQTAMNGLLAAIAMPAYLVHVANMIDGDWTLAVERADGAGKELARTLLFSKAGRRPVTLIGFSFGGRIIYNCLKELARFQEDWEEHQELLQGRAEGKLSTADEKRCSTMDKKFHGMREPASIVEDAILMGLPNHLSLASWRACRQVVSGRLVNCYSTTDMILSVMFRSKRFRVGGLDSNAEVLRPVCGTCAVKVPGVENFDVSDLVPGHESYCTMTGKVLERIRLGHPLRSSSSAAPPAPTASSATNATASTRPDGSQPGIAVAAPQVQRTASISRKLEYSS